MDTLLILKDESATGEVMNTVRLTVPSEALTLRELLKRRVQHEVQRFNRERPVSCQALVYPEDAQVIDKGFRLSQHRDLDWERQVQCAEQAVLSGALTVYIDNKPVTALDAILPVRDAMEVSFVKLSFLFAG